MRRLTLVRHGITEWNLSGQFQGHTDIALSEKGRKQAAALAKHLEEMAPTVDLVYSSPLSRAAETAQTVFPNREIIYDDRLKELNFGSFEGFTQAENEQHEAWEAWFANPFERAAPGGESYQALMTRAAAWLATLPREADSFAFAHAGTIRMLISHVLGLEKPTWRKRIFLNHTSLTRILFQDDEAVIERVNDTRHLAPNGIDPFAD